MAIWSHASGGVVDAMESAIALRAPTDLRDKIFHLETRIESVEDAPRRETEGSSVVTRKGGNIQAVLRSRT